MPELGNNISLKTLQQITSYDLFISESEIELFVTQT